MKKAMLRKLRELSEEFVGKEETDKIIKETVNEVLEETKPKKKEILKDKKKKSDK